MKDNLILASSYAFSLEVMAVVRDLREKREFDLASQFWRSGTSVGANVEEAQAAQSRLDFLSKMAIAAKEARESRYWLRLARDGKVLPAKRIDPLLEKIDSILRVLTSIVKTTSESKIQNPKSRITSPP